MFADPAFWVAIAFLLFVGMVIYLKIPGMIVSRLDARADKIRNELDEAQKLREDAQALFAEYQRKQRDAMATAEDIVTKAKEDAERIREEGEEALDAALNRRRALAEDKIRQAEEKAIAEVRAVAVDVAMNAAGTIIASELKGAKANKMIDETIAGLAQKLN